MDEHRKQMQKQAERWQGTSIRILRRVRYSVLIFAAIAVICMFIANLGFPKNVEERLPACVITENGEMLNCEIVLRGEVTDYIVKKAKYGMEDRVKVWFGDRWLVEFEYYHGTSEYAIADAYWDGNTVEGLMSRKRDLLILELDAKMLFPEMDSQRCVLVAPGENGQGAIEILRNVCPEELITSLKWIEKIKG